MPALYRSKSVRRFDEVNCRITSIIEKDNNKVLATAAVQLFISTPQLEKWFKSSTGTICFLKDLTRKNFFYFRLYSLMVYKITKILLNTLNYFQHTNQNYSKVNFGSKKCNRLSFTKSSVQFFII